MPAPTWEFCLRAFEATENKAEMLYQGSHAMEGERGGRLGVVYHGSHAGDGREGGEGQGAGGRGKKGLFIVTSEGLYCRHQPPEDISMQLELRLTLADHRAKVTSTLHIERRARKQANKSTKLTDTSAIRSSINIRLITHQTVIRSITIIPVLVIT